MEFTDVPAILLQDCKTEIRHARITVTQRGIFAGALLIEKEASLLGLKIVYLAKDGQQLDSGDIVCELSGEALDLIRGEDKLIGLISKASGIATAGVRAREYAKDMAVVCGGWKKIPVEYKPVLALALDVAGVRKRLSLRDFIYLDKNYVRIFGGVGAAVKNAKDKFPGREVVGQIKGQIQSVDDEINSALDNGADIIMIDTGSLQDLRRAVEIVSSRKLSDRITIAFAGGVLMEELPAIRQAGAEVVDIGRQILDAPMLDYRYDVC